MKKFFELIKKTLSGILFWIVWTAVFYSVFASVSGKLNLTMWQEIDRTHFALYGPMLGFFIILLYWVIQKIK